MWGVDLGSKSVCWCCCVWTNTNSNTNTKLPSWQSVIIINVERNAQLLFFTLQMWIDSRVYCRKIECLFFSFENRPQIHTAMIYGANVVHEYTLPPKAPKSEDLWVYNCMCVCYVVCMRVCVWGNLLSRLGSAVTKGSKYVNTYLRKYVSTIHNLFSTEN